MAMNGQDDETHRLLFGEDGVFRERVGEDGAAASTESLLFPDTSASFSRFRSGNRLTLLDAINRLSPNEDGHFESRENVAGNAGVQVTETADRVNKVLERVLGL
jgi:hypothetical protein